MANLLELWLKKNDLRAVKEKLDEGRKRESRRAYAERKKKEEAAMGKHVKTYAEYLEEGKNRPPSPHLAPLTARPKRTKGDSHVGREREEKAMGRGLIPVHELRFNKNGTITRSSIKQVKRKVYKIQEKNHGR